MKILLLEDDLELCKNIKISLEKENYIFLTHYLMFDIPLYFPLFLLLF